jgi:hypothetical protein
MWGGDEGWGVIGDLGSGSSGVGSAASPGHDLWGLQWRTRMIDDFIEEKDFFGTGTGVQDWQPT